MTLLYCRSSCPSEDEVFASQALEGRVNWRNGARWGGEIEKADMVVTSHKAIRTAYWKAGVTVRKTETLARKGRNLTKDGNGLE